MLTKQVCFTFSYGQPYKPLRMNCCTNDFPGRHRTDYASRIVHEDALPRVKAAVLEQPLPRGQARHNEGRAHREVINHKIDIFMEKQGRLAIAAGVTHPEHQSKWDANIETVREKTVLKRLKMSRALLFP